MAKNGAWVMNIEEQARPEQKSNRLMIQSGSKWCLDVMSEEGMFDYGVSGTGSWFSWDNLGAFKEWLYTTYNSTRSLI